MLKTLIAILAIIGMDPGVSRALADLRKDQIAELRYDLSFDIPKDSKADVYGREVLTFDLASKGDVILDFREDASKIKTVTANGRSCKTRVENEHILIPKRYTRRGENVIEIVFIAGNQSLNRRDGYMYTLFVPDRARTVFPCFDQPDLKGRFTLHLFLPEGWTAVTNSPVLGTARPNVMNFAESEPLPTYLFAFAAGEFKRQEWTEDGRTIGAYYRETDSERIAQLPEIFRQVQFALRWQEEFTGVPYPFSKYDLVILPGFQFGGMEHTGATFYNDNTIFLPKNPTVDDELKRTELITHETSHMWFGDAVTMSWFNDVWTKEVFANYFAAEITEPLYPQVNHSLNWLKTYVASAVSQDRTEGRTSIRQDLDNLSDAGLVYNNIIYNKAPVMMREMVRLMGKEAFQRGIREYVKTYLYGNATWDDLIAILDAQTDVDLREFSRDWVETARFPRYTAKSCMDNHDGSVYGYFEMTPPQLDSLMARWQRETDATCRQAMLMTLQENYYTQGISDSKWMRFLLQGVAREKDPLMASSLIGCLYEPMLQQPDAESEMLLWTLSRNHSLPSARTQLVRLLMSRARSEQLCWQLMGLWQQGSEAGLSENDWMTLSWELAIRFPQKADEILSRQRERISNPDRLAQFDFVSRAVSPSAEDRDAFFDSLMDARNRRIEPWALSALYYLNHPLRDEESVKYIRPALDLLPEIQRTGDIFFPGSWCDRLLAGHRCPEAYEEVQAFLEDNPNMKLLLKNKVLSAEFFLSLRK